MWTSKLISSDKIIVFIVNIERNLDLILVQAKQLDIERYVDSVTTSLHLDISSLDATTLLLRRKRTLSNEYSAKLNANSGATSAASSSNTADNIPRKASFVEDIHEKLQTTVNVEKKNYKV
jgi:hypothetical protein